MTDREAFEKWHIEYASREPRLDAPPGHWADDKKAWAAYQAAIKAEREACAEVCDELLIDDQQEATVYDHGVRDCAAAIRARSLDG